jgi:hypothetical protein
MRAVKRHARLLTSPVALAEKNGLRPPWVPHLRPTFEYSRHELGSYVVLRSGVAVGKLIQQASVLFTQIGETI